MVLVTTGLLESLCVGSRSQNVLCTNFASCTRSSKLKETDTRSTEEILAGELPGPEEPDALETAAIRFHRTPKHGREQIPRRMQYTIFLGL